jgi:hypothetical protein
MFLNNAVFRRKSREKRAAPYYEFLYYRGFPKTSGLEDGLCLSNNLEIRGFA